MIFEILSVVMIGLLSTFAVYFIKVLKVKKGQWRTLPREKYIGIAMMALVFVYAAYHGRFMLEGGLATYRPYVWFLIPIATALAYFFLDFIFTRALGGILVVLTLEILSSGYIINLPYRGLFSAHALIYGIIGLVLIGLPWKFRNFVQKACEQDLFRRVSGGLLMSSALFYFLFLILSF